MDSVDERQIEKKSSVRFSPVDHQQHFLVRAQWLQRTTSDWYNNDAYPFSYSSISECVDYAYVTLVKLGSGIPQGHLIRECPMSVDLAAGVLGQAMLVSKESEGLSVMAKLLPLAAVVPSTTDGQADIQYGASLFLNAVCVRVSVCLCVWIALSNTCRSLRYSAL